MHIFNNMVFQAIFGFPMESVIGWLKMALIYFGSAIGGILYSSLVSPKTYSAGASTALMGILGADLAWLVLNWVAMSGENLKQLRSILTCIVIFIILIEFFMGFSSQIIPSSTDSVSTANTDNYGHLFGLISGFLLGCCAMDTLDSARHKWEKNLIRFGLVMSIVYFGLGFSLFFTVIK